VHGVERRDALAPLRVVDADDGHLRDARHRRDDVLHLAGVDVVAA
jgi:hypothetical protein